MKTRFPGVTLALVALLGLGACGETRAPVTELSQLAKKEFAVPTGTVADQLVKGVFPDARFQYYNSVLDAEIGRAHV